MSDPRRSPTKATLLGAGITVAYLLPVFLTGALAPQIREELSFSATGLGASVSVYWGMAAVTSASFGRLVDRIGAVASMRLAAIIAAGCSLGIALTVHRWSVLVVWLALGGCALSIGQPAANRMIAQVVPAARLGIAFGVKQSAPPTATMLAGASVPLLAAIWGWRPAFISAAVLAATIGVSAGRRDLATRGARRREQERLRDPAVIAVLTAAFSVGAGTALAVATFFVESVAVAGLGTNAAGTVLAAASIASIGVRVVAGGISDRVPRGHLRGCAALMLLGSAGIGLLATDRPGLMSVGVVLALAGTWGFPGVFWFALIRAYMDSPGRITGVVGAGVLLGGTFGPTLFGLLVDATSFPVAWAVSAGVGVLGAAATLYGDGRLALSTRQASR